MKWLDLHFCKNDQFSLLAKWPDFIFLQNWQDLPFFFAENNFFLSLKWPKAKKKILRDCYYYYYLGKTYVNFLIPRWVKIKLNTTLVINIYVHDNKHNHMRNTKTKF